MPEKKQGRLGTSIWKRRGVRSERAEEPMMERVGVEGSRRMEVTIMWGMWWVEWSVEIASEREGRDRMVTPERVLGFGGLVSHRISR